MDGARTERWIVEEQQLLVCVHDRLVKNQQIRMQLGFLGKVGGREGGWEGGRERYDIESKALEGFVAIVANDLAIDVDIRKRLGCSPPRFGTFVVLGRLALFLVLLFLLGLGLRGEG